MLVTIPKEEEIFKAVFSLGGDKSPGLDGFPMFFFQKEWNLVGKYVCSAIKEFSRAKCLLKEIYSTFFYLIPKKVWADSPDQFRPISFFNSFYKIISKVLTSRLFLVLQSLIAN